MRGLEGPKSENRELTYAEVIHFLARRIADKQTKGPHIAELIKAWKDDEETMESPFEDVMQDEDIEIDVFEEVMTILEKEETK